METAYGVTMLKVPVNLMGKTGVIHPTLICDHDTVILVDTGLPGQLGTLREALQRAKLPFDRINTVILTHHDIDHIGGLREIRSALPHPITVLAHSEEKAYVEGAKRPLKLGALEDNLDKLPEPSRALYQTLKRAFENAAGSVDQTLADGEELPYCGGITVVFTPGHTLGHISLYVKATKTLIAGDALCVEDGVLNATPTTNNYDATLYKQSLQKLSKLDIETVICYHGGLFQGEASRRITALARKAMAAKEQPRPANKTPRKTRTQGAVSSS